jgi:RNA polymerase sigma factor (sigma-70 family)
MLRRAFRGAFAADELDDIYASAWVGTLRALEPKHDELTDEEIRSYLFTAVAHQAGKELRRRKRKPIAPLELAAAVADDASSSPEDSAATAEESRVTRDLLASLPARRRAVILLRYGWGLEPKQICKLIKDLTPRAYRKEITRGVDELAERIRQFEAGEWCNDREAVLKAYAAGLASADQERQAQAHLAHCRACSDFMARLSGHLHDLGSAIAVPTAVDGIDGHLSIGDRLVAFADRAGGVFSRGDGSTAQEAASTAATSGGAKGAGAAGAGVFAKLAGLGTAGKVALACAGGSAALTACVAAGIGPVSLPAEQGPTAVEVTSPDPKPDGAGTVQPSPPVEVSTAQGAAGSPQGTEDQPRPDPEPEQGSSDSSADKPAEAPAPTPVAPSTPPAEQEFGIAAAAAPVQPTTSSGSSSSSSSGTNAATVRQEFGP